MPERKTHRKGANSPLDALEVTPRRSQQEVLHGRFTAFLHDRIVEWGMMLNLYLEIEDRTGHPAISAAIEHSEMVLDRLQWLSDAIPIIADSDMHRWIVADLPTLDILVDAERTYGGSPEAIAGLVAEHVELHRERQARGQRRRWRDRISIEQQAAVREQAKLARHRRIQARREEARAIRRAEDRSRERARAQRPPRAVAIFPGVAPGLRNLPASEAS